MTIATPIETTEAPVRTKTIPEVLRHAAMVIEERGHFRGGYVGPSGTVCAWGAINVAVYGTATVPYQSGRIPLAVHALWLYTGDPAIGHWNDARTAAEVIAALRAAAAAYESR